MRSVLQDWVQELGLRHQGVLLGITRGCDNTPKEDVSKRLVRALRAEILVSFDDEPSSFIEPIKDVLELSQLCVTLKKNCDHYAHHFFVHLLHAVEIVGYHHPDVPRRTVWRAFYNALCHGMHVNQETKEQLDARLTADEDTFASNAK